MAARFFTSGLSDREKSVLCALEYRARMNDYTFMSLRTIARLTEKSLRSVQEIIARLESNGWIKTVHERGRHSAYCGIVMLRRVNRDLPCARTPAEIQAAVGFLRGLRVVWDETDRVTKSAHYNKKPCINGSSIGGAGEFDSSERKRTNATLVYPLILDEDESSSSAHELAEHLEDIVAPGRDPRRAGVPHQHRLAIALRPTGGRRVESALLRVAALDDGGAQPQRTGRAQRDCRSLRDRATWKPPNVSPRDVHGATAWTVAR
jgi:DNA-binding Lrp family transcriptional regulator